MASTNVFTIPLYTKGYLTAVGYREGCGYNAKIFWGSELLASRPSLTDAAMTAYIGTRLYSPKFHSWMTHALRVEILEELEKMSLLIFPTEIHSTNPDLLKNLKTGMKWFLSNKLEIKLGEDAIEPERTVEIIKNEFMKSDRLMVHIKLLSDFTTNPQNDLFSVSVGEEVPKKTLQMCVMEDNLPVSLFGSNWTSNAVSSFNSFRRISAQPGEGYPVRGTLEKMAFPDKLTPIDTESYRSTGHSKLNAMLSGSKTNEFSLNLNGNTISLTGNDLTISAPKFDLTCSGQMGYSSKLDVIDGGIDQRMKECGIPTDIDTHIPVCLVQSYMEKPYLDHNTKMPMDFMHFCRILLGWDYVTETLEDWVARNSGLVALYQKDRQIHDIIHTAFMLRDNPSVMISVEGGKTKHVNSMLYSG